MGSMVTWNNQYFCYELVSLSLCFCLADLAYNRRTNHIDITNGASNSHVVLTTTLRHNISQFIAASMVTILKLSVFTMGKLTQSQKELFLWKSPSAKLQWFLIFWWDSYRTWSVCHLNDYNCIISCIIYGGQGKKEKERSWKQRFHLSLWKKLSLLCCCLHPC